AKSILERIERHYADSVVAIDHIDGLSLEFPEWRFNLRGSNTEPLVRLNVESRASEALMREKTDEVLKLLEA
ncbi:protein containing Alpha-D-phosphohexomutase, partial [mine drainage metagenome]